MKRPAMINKLKKLWQQIIATPYVKWLRRWIFAYGLSHCIGCREKIPQGATLCNKCDSYQDWRRFFSFSQVTLTLVVAIIATLAAALPVYQAGTWRTAKSELKIHPAYKITCEMTRNGAYDLIHFPPIKDDNKKQWAMLCLNIACTNSGNAPGAITKITYQKPGEDSKSPEHQVDFIFGSNPGAQIIGPNTTVSFWACTYITPVWIM